MARVLAPGQVFRLPAVEILGTHVAGDVVRTAGQLFAVKTGLR